VSDNEKTTQQPETVCECSHWWAGETVDTEDGDLAVEHEMTTGCPGNDPVRHTFAQGHDAKLKSLLIRAGVAGLEVHDGRGTSTDAIGAARQFGWTDQVQNGIERAKTRATALLKCGCPRQLVRDSGHQDGCAAGERKPRSKGVRGAERAIALQARMTKIAGGTKIVEGSEAGDAIPARVAAMVRWISAYATDHADDPMWNQVYREMTDEQIAAVVADAVSHRDAQNLMQTHLEQRTDPR
jgi:hypothetical protein